MTQRCSATRLGVLAAAAVLAPVGATTLAGQSPGLTPRVTVQVGLNPHQIAFSPDGARVYVAAAGSDRIAILDSGSAQVRTSLEVPGTPMGVAVLDGGSSLVVSRFGSDRLARVGASAGALLEELHVGGAPSLLIGPFRGQRLLVSSEATDRLLVVDTESFQLEATVPVGRRPFPPSATSDGRVALVPGYDDGTVTRVDVAAGQAVWQLEVGDRPSGGAVLPGDTLYAVAIRGEDRVALVDIDRGRVVGDVREGIGDEPFSVVVSPALRVAFVNNTASHDISVIDLSTLEVVERVPVPEIPIVMAVHPDGGSLWVSSEGQDGVTVLDIPASYRGEALAALQGPGGTDIWVADLVDREGWPQLRSLRRVTDRVGYDNQPHLLPGGRVLLYTSVDGQGQADIWRADLESTVAEPFARTAPESEYSATLMPDGRSISVVRVEADSTQRLWRFDRDGEDPELIVEGVAPVGYHVWADEATVVVFVLGDPPTLQVVDVESGAARVVAERVGRSLHRIPNREAISFVEFDERGSATIRALDVASGVTTTLVPARSGSQDHAWTPDGVLLMAEGSELHTWTPEGGWRFVADLAAQGLREITRLAVSPEGDVLALVASR
jgi:YVTN family beta-propeller protein